MYLELEEAFKQATMLAILYDKLIQNAETISSLNSHLQDIWQSKKGRRTENNIINWGRKTAEHLKEMELLIQDLQREISSWEQMDLRGFIETGKTPKISPNFATGSAAVYLASIKPLKPLPKPTVLSGGETLRPNSNRTRVLEGGETLTPHSSPGERSIPTAIRNKMKGGWTRNNKPNLKTGDHDNKNTTYIPDASDPLSVYNEMQQKSRPKLDNDLLIDVVNPNDIMGRDDILNRDDWK
jgi:hypothetical protein